MEIAIVIYIDWLVVLIVKGYSLRSYVDNGKKGYGFLLILTSVQQLLGKSQYAKKFKFV